jgi:hypothetical protein
MLVSFWSPKGGAGTSVFAAACSLLLARHTDVRLADFGGDQPAILGCTGEPSPGLTEWLLTGPDAPADALDRLAVDVANGLTLLPRGEHGPADASPEAGAALAVVLASDERITIADVAHADNAALQAVVELSDMSIVIVPGCYLALRRAVRTPLTSLASGVVVPLDKERSLGASDVSEVLRLPMLATVPVRPGIAAAVDAGVLGSRMPDGLARSARRLFDRLGLPGRAGRAA